MMMSYEQFKYLVKKEIRKYLPEEMRDCEISYHQMSKINEEKDAITFRGHFMSPRMSPTIYLDEMYKEYLEYGEFDATMIHTFYGFEKHIKEGNCLFQSLDFKNPQGHIICQLINTEQNQKLLCDMPHTEQNKELLKGMPHREWKEFSIVYRCILAIDEYGRVLASLPISKSIAQQMDLTEVELYAIAMENMREHYPVRIERMDKVICRFLDQSVFSKEDLEKAKRWYIITNSLGWHGATSILDSERLHQLATEVGSNLYLMPTSTHEFTAIAVEDFNLERNRNYTRENNLESIDVRDRISNDIYLYDREKRKISMIVKSPYRTLDK